MKFRALLFAVLLSFLAVPGFSAERRDLLTGRYNREQVSRYCDDSSDWIRFPAYADRAAWEAIPASRRSATISAGERYLGYDWPAILPTMYLEFSRTGNRNVVDVAIATRLSVLRTLFYAEMMEGKGRFIDDIINGIFTYCEQTYWGMSATFYLYEYGDSQSHPKTKLPDASNPVIDLSVGDVASTLSWIWYFLHDEFDKVSPIVGERLKSELRRKVLEPFYTRNDFWWITGWNHGDVNNWTPWCNYNVLTTILLMEPDRARRLDGICKTMQSVDLFINIYPEDGGCNEGPSYWGHGVGSLFNYLSLLYDFSKGGIDIFHEDVVREMGRYVNKLYIGGGVNFVNFADAPGKINHDGIRIARFGQRIGDPSLEAFGSFLSQKQREDALALSKVYRAEFYGSEDTEKYDPRAISGDIGQTLSDLFAEGLTEVPREVLPKEIYLPDLQVVAARDKENDSRGFFFAAKGGNNQEQHNHNDVGSFVLYYDGQPVFIDPGVGTYTRETFSNDRYSLWTMQSGYHNLPLIRGVMQQAGSRYKAADCTFKSSRDVVTFSADIAPAYPEGAGATRWVRSYTLRRGKSFTVKDAFVLSETGDGTPAGCVTGPTSVIFMTPLEPVLEASAVMLAGKGFRVRLSYPASRLRPRVEEMKLEDTRLSNVWGDRIYRIVFDVDGPDPKGNLTFEVTAGETGEGAVEKEASPSSIVQVVDAAILWQKTHMPTAGRAIYNPRYTGWADGVFLSAVAEWTQAVGNEGLRAWVKEVAEQVNYEPASWTLNPANDIAVCMLYANLYREDPKPRFLIDTIADYGRQLEVLRGGWKMIGPTVERLDYMMKDYPQMDDDLDFNLSRNQVRWCWCDALYMAAPTFAAFADITGDVRYRDFMKQEFWRTVRALYDTEEHLFYRDTRYKTIRSRNGAKMFWGRGNGWSVGAIVRVLENLPPDDPDRGKFEQLLREMLSRLVTLQDAEGYWNTSLLDREFYPNPETSASGFIAYGLWWGINHGVLPAGEYLPAAWKAWDALVRAVHPDGMLGSVQAIGDAPENITPEKNEVYGTAAFALAGKEVYQYLSTTQSTTQSL